MPKRLAILLSGRGSNFAAIHDAILRGELDAEIALVISNRASAAGLEDAERRGLATAVIPHREFPSREAHEEAIAASIERSGSDIVALAGYMRLLSASFIERFSGRVLNIHPSLLPAFPGTDAQAQALAHGVKVSGCTVHLVDATLDGGPILVQRAVPVRDDDTPDTLAARILVEEHHAYVEALRIIVSGDYRVVGRRVVVGGRGSSAPRS